MMNRFIYALSICAAMFVMACNSSNDKAVNTTPETLDGTTWFGECEDETTHDKYDASLTFSEDGSCTWVLRDEIGDIFSSKEYAYQYTAPNVTLFSVDDETGDEVIVYNGFVLDKDQATMNGYNVYTIWLYDTKGNMAASFWKF